MTNREQELEAVVERLIAAMKDSIDYGCTDHLDCCEDAGAFWYDAIDEAQALLDSPVTKDS